MDELSARRQAKNDSFEDLKNAQTLTDVQKCIKILDLLLSYGTDLT